MPKDLTVIPVDGGGSCWPGRVQLAGGKCCGSGTPDQFIVTQGIFPYISVFWYFPYILAAYLVGSLSQLLVGKEKAGRVAHHPLLLPTEPVVVGLPSIVWVHNGSAASLDPRCGSRSGLRS